MALTLSLRFPTGRYAAAAWDDREQAEWPPHPARLVLAFTDVLHKTGSGANLRQALEWLCRQGAPTVVVPTGKRVDIQRMDGFYVPQNPTVAGGPKHPRKPRAFPTVHLDSEEATVSFHWPDADADESIMGSLRELSGRLPRFGHSSSLVMVAASTDDPPSGKEWTVWQPISDPDHPADIRLRVPYSGLLDSAETAYAVEDRAIELESLLRKAAKSVKAGKVIKPSASARGRHDPRHQWQGYAERLSPDTPTSVWENRVLLLARVGGERPGLSSTWQVIETLHKTMLDCWCRESERGPVPSWISGHQPGSGSTDPARHNHLAFFPVADVNHTHAQGRLMGLGIAFPRAESTEVDGISMRLDWQKAMAALFPQGEPLELVSPASGIRFTLQPASPDESRHAFQSARWVRPSANWASITPVILDRHPKPHFSKDPGRWAQSARRIITSACERIGLPAPIGVEVSPYSSIEGVPPSSAFAPPPPRPGRPARVHIHVVLRFDQKVAGPILLGAGRFRGYGLLGPVD